jgi:capsid portal protein
VCEKNTADNTNSNFGDVKRKEEENVFRKVQSDLDRPIVGIGCSAHIVHNSVQTACDSLPLDIEVIVIKIYKYFHIYAVTVTKLKQFCEFVETEKKSIRP